MDPLSCLPPEIVQMVVRQLPPLDLVSLSRVSRAWRAVARDPALWRAAGAAARRALHRPPAQGPGPRQPQAHHGAAVRQVQDIPPHVQRQSGQREQTEAVVVALHAVTCAGQAGGALPHRGTHGYEDGPPQDGVGRGGEAAGGPPAAAAEAVRAQRRDLAALRQSPGHPHQRQQGNPAHAGAGGGATVLRAGR